LTALVGSEDILTESSVYYLLYAIRVGVMPRFNPKFDVLRALFARSGNQCAFPGCTHSLINEKNQFIGQVCHIEAASPNGQRFNPNQSDEQRRAYENLVLLCYPHHVETNDAVEYSVERIRNIKYEHESRFEKNLYQIDEAVLHKIVDEMETFWNQVEKLNKLEHSIKEFSVDIDARGSFFEVMSACRKNVQYLQEFFDAFRESEKDIRSNWELHYIGAPNRMNRLRIDLTHLEIKYLEEYLKTHTDDPVARKRLDSLKEEFKEIAQHAAVID